MKVGILTTIPTRIDTLSVILNSVTPQVDTLYVICNEYSAIPDVVKHYPNIIPLLSSGEDRASEVFKLSILQQPDNYVFIFDDDIIYPPDYVQKLSEKIDYYNRKVIVVVHGYDFHTPFMSYVSDQIFYMLTDELDEDVRVHCGGVGTCGFHTSEIRLDSSVIRTVSRDINLALWAWKHSVPIMCISRTKDWIKRIHPKGKTMCSTIFGDRTLRKAKDEIIATELLPLLSLERNQTPRKFRRNVFIDLGAHLGESVKKFSQCVRNFDRWKVFCFEPCCPNRLRQNLPQANITCIAAAAVGGDEKYQNLFLSKTNSSLSATTLRGKESVDYSSSEVVPAINFRKWFDGNIREEDLVIIKSNIEGGEYNLIPVFIDLLRQDRIHGMWLKLHLYKFSKDVRTEFVKQENALKQTLKDIATPVFLDHSNNDYNFPLLVREVEKQFGITLS